MGFRLRAGRGTNLALLVLLAGALVTGGIAFAIGGGWAFWALAAHGAVGLALVLLAPWKSVISARGIKRARPGTPASILLAVLIVLTTVTGVGHAMGWWSSLLAMQLHVGAALLSIPLALWHVVRRSVAPKVSDLASESPARGCDRGRRRRGVRGGGGAGTCDRDARRRPSLDRLLRTWVVRSRLDARDAMAGRRAADGRPADWRLLVRSSGSDRPGPTTSSRARRRIASEPRSTARAGGTRPRTGPGCDRPALRPTNTRSFVVVSATRFARRFPVTDAAAMVLALRLGDRELSAGHGFPARLVVPGRRGFWWVKWVERIEASGTPGGGNRRSRSRDGPIGSAMDPERTQHARRLFAGIAPEYDRMGSVLSFGRDALAAVPRLEGERDPGVLGARRGDRHRARRPGARAHGTSA